MSSVPTPEQNSVPFPAEPAYAFVDELLNSPDAFTAQREFELGGDYGSDSSGAAYVGPVGALALVINAPGEAVGYQRAFEEREISALDFMAIMVRETAEARMASIKAAGVKIASGFGRVRESFAGNTSHERPASEGIVALAAGSAATRRAIML